MATSTATEEFIYSTLATDPDLNEIVEMYVDEMGDRIRSFESLLEQANWDELGRQAHQMKGAAGGYGFSPLTQLAASLELATRGGGSEEEIETSLLELVEACRRARAGVPS